MISDNFINRDGDEGIGAIGWTRSQACDRNHVGVSRMTGGSNKPHAPNRDPEAISLTQRLQDAQMVPERREQSVQCEGNMKA